jgi:hypothetical protein
VCSSLDRYGERLLLFTRLLWQEAVNDRLRRSLDRFARSLLRDRFARSLLRESSSAAVTLQVLDEVLLMLLLDR